MARTNNKDVHRGIVLYIDGKEVANNAKAIRAEMKKVRQEIDGMTRGSDEYVRATKKYRELDGILQHHRQQLKAVETQQKSMLQRGIAFFRDYSLQITGAIAAITGVAIELNKFRKQAAEKEDAAANLKALTGLDDDNIKWLTAQAEKLSTTMEASGLRVRKSATEILEAYMLVGSKKPELLQDKEALNAVTIEAMRLAEAAKMELKDAVAGLTLAMNQYGASAEEATRYVNVLAAGSKYGAVGVATQTEAIVKAGVAASTAKVPIEQLVGVIETLGEKGIEGSIAGTQLKTFFLKLEAGAKDTRPSVVGLQTALERLAAKNLDVTEMTKLFGLETITTAKALISSADKVKHYTDAVTATNVAVEQAAINSDTTAARMAQVRNQLNLTGQELAKDLAPILNKTIGWTRKFVMLLPAIIDFLKKYGASTLTLVAALALYNTYTTIATKATGAWNAVVAFARTQANGFTASMAAYRTALTGSTTAHIEMTAAVRGTNIVTQAGVVVVGLLKAAYFALTLQMGLCARTLKMVKVALAESGYGLAIIAIGAAVAAIMRHNEKMKEARRLAEEQRQAERALYKEYNEAAARIRRLRKVAEDNNKTLDERRKAIEELQKLAPDYQASISEEGRLIEQNKGKLDEYLERLKASIVLEAYKAKMSELLQKQMEAEDDQRAASDEYWKKRQENTLQGWDRNGATAGIMRFFGLDDEENAKKAKDKADKVLTDINKDIEDTEQRMKDLAEKWNFSLVDEQPSTDPVAGSTSDNDTTDTTTPETAAERQKRIREAIAAVDADYDARANDLRQKYLNGEILTEQEYSQRLQDIELQRLDDKMQIAGLEPQQREQLRQRILDIKMKLVQQLRQLDDIEADNEQNRLQRQLDANAKAELQRQAIIDQAHAAGLLSEEEYNAKAREILDRRVADDSKAYEQMAATRLKLSRKQLDAQLFEIRKQRAQEFQTEEKYNNTIRQAKLQFYDNALQDQQLSSEDREQLQRERDQIALEEHEEHNAKLIEQEQKLADAMNSLGQEIGQALADFLTDSEKDFGDFMKELVKTVLNTIEKLVLAYVAETTARNVGTLGFWGLAKAAGEAALITAAFETAKAAIGGFQSGGYTGKGRPDEERGIVHAGEFVANRYAVANDAVRPVLDLIDQAQRSGTIANLTADDIAAATASPSRPSASSTPAVSVPAGFPGGNPSPRDPELTAALHLLTRTTARAAEAYRTPSPAYCYLEGQGGITTAQDLLDKMKSNASRK